MYFTQLMGMALGIEPKRIGVGASMLSLAQSTAN
jgi:heterodisulfide reductase subunit B